MAARLLWILLPRRERGRVREMLAERIQQRFS
jgi:hypothetical protein